MLEPLYYRGGLGGLVDWIPTPPPPQRKGRGRPANNALNDLIKRTSNIWRRATGGWPPATRTADGEATAALFELLARNFEISPATWSRAQLWPAGGFAAAFEGSRAASDAAQLEGEPIAEALVALTARGPWTGSMTDLLAALDAIVDDRLRASHAWPKAPRALSSRLDRAAPVLRRLGLEVEKTRSASLDRTRLVTIRRIEPSRSSKPSSAEEMDVSSDGYAWTKGADDRATLDDPAAPLGPIVQPKSLIYRDLDDLDDLDDRRGPFRARFAGEL